MAGFLCGGATIVDGEGVGTLGPFPYTASSVLITLCFSWVAALLFGKCAYKVHRPCAGIREEPHTHMPLTRHLPLLFLPCPALPCTCVLSCVVPGSPRLSCAGLCQGESGVGCVSAWEGSKLRLCITAVLFYGATMLEHFLLATVPMRYGCIGQMAAVPVAIVLGWWWGEPMNQIKTAGCAVVLGGMAMYR